MKPYVSVLAVGAIALHLSACGKPSETKKTVGVLPNSGSEKVSSDEQTTLDNLSAILLAHAWCAGQDNFVERIRVERSGFLFLDRATPGTGFSSANTQSVQGTWSLKKKQLEAKLPDRTIHAQIDTSKTQADSQNPQSILLVTFDGATKAVSYTACDN